MVILLSICSQHLAFIETLDKASQKLIKRPGVVAHAHNPSTLGGGDRRIRVHGHPQLSLSLSLSLSVSFSLSHSLSLSP